MPKPAAIFVDPDTVLSSEQVLTLKKGLAFLHFYGYADYTDIFKRKRRTTVHMRWGGTFKGMISEYWEPVGLSQENRDT